MDGQGVSDDGDKKALLINHQLNKHKSSQSKACEQEKCHKQINRKKGSSFKALKQSVGKYWGYLSHFNQSRAEGIPGDFQQQQDEKIRLSKPAPLTTKPPQARLLRENRYRVKSGKQIRLKKNQKTSGRLKPTHCWQSIPISFSVALLRKKTTSYGHGVMANVWSSNLTRDTWGVGEEGEDGRGLSLLYLYAKKHTLPPHYQAAICRALWASLLHNGPQHPAWYPQLSP